MSAEPAYEQESRVEKTTILVVEDEVLIRLMIADALREQGFSVVEASNGDEALTVLQSSLPVDLLLTDIRMPSKMDGLVLARVARAARPDLKLIIASSQRADGDFADIADAFFCKPYDVNVLVGRVKTLLRSSQNAARGQ